MNKVDDDEASDTENRRRFRTFEFNGEAKRVRTVSPGRVSKAIKQKRYARGQKRLEEGDDCAICYEEMNPAKLVDLTFCETCNKPVHKGCFSQCTFSTASISLHELRSYQGRVMRGH